MKLLCVLLCLIGGALLPSESVFAKEEVRAPHWRWVHPNLPLWGHFETADEARQLWNLDQEQKYAACIARACSNCAKTIVGPVTKPALGTTAKINSQFTYVTNAEAVGTSVYTACNGNPPQGPTTAPNNHTIAIASQRYCPAGFSARNITTPPGYEVIDGVQVVSYASECFKEIPDPPQCSKVPQTDTRCGNPVDAMAGSKIVAETDYASADGLLRVARSYSSAIGGWTWGHRATLLDFTARGTTRPPETDLVSNLKLRPVGIRDVSIPAIDTPVSFPLVKPAASGSMVWLIAADGRTAFAESATNVFSTTSLDKSQLSVGNAGGTHEWRVKSPPGSLRVFNAAGRLSREVFAEGKSLTYSYAGDAVTVTAIPGGRRVVYSRSNDDVPAGKHDVVTLPDGTEMTYAFDTAGMVTKVMYADGRNKTYLYNEPAHAPPPSSGGSWVRLTGLLDESNVRLGTYKYNAEAPISTELAGGANRFALTYFNGRTEFTRPPLNATEIVRWDVGPDGERRVTSRQQPATVAGSATGTSTITYDAGGYVASVLDYNGYRTCYSHDQSRGLETFRVEGFAVGVGCPLNLAAHTVPANTRQRKISTQWHPAWNFPAAIAQPRKITRWVYNGQPDPTTGTTASCAPLTALLPDGSPIAVVCRKIEQATTDATGTAAFGATVTGAPRSWSYTYNSFGQVLTADGPRDDVPDVTTYAYYECDTGNECGQLAGVTNSLGHVTTYDVYNAHGQPLTITNPNNVVTTLTYDLRQRLKSRTVGSELTRFDYWPTGLLKKATFPDGSYLDYAYDAAHRLTDINDSDGNRIHYSLDNAGNRILEEFFDAYSPTATQTRARAYDELSRLHREMGAAGGDAVTTTYNYDKNGNQTTIFAPLDRDTTQVYDELNRLTQVTDPLNGVTNYGYNASDQLISVTDPKRLVTSYDYDGLGDLKQQTSPDTGVTANTYDGGGNLKTSTDARGAVATYTYDELNRVATASFAVGSSVDQLLTYSYDEGAYGLGRLTGASDADHSLAWAYDEQGRVMAATQTVGSVSKTTGYSYLNGLRQSLTTPSGQVITYGYTNGKITSISVNGAVLVSDVLYEPFGPVRQWTWGNGTLSVRTFDKDRKIVAIDSAGLKTYTYDDAFRITDILDASDASQSWQYEYDDLDHLASASKAGTTFGYQYDANGNRHTQTGTGASSFTIATGSNRLTSTSGALTRTYGYDNAGNTTSFGGITFTYNNRGRMKSSTKNGVTTNYTYNALGQLIKKGVSALYFYDDDGHVLGIYGSTGALTEEIVWLGNIPLATLRPRAGGGVDAYYIHSDHLNTPRLITDESNNVRWKWDVEPFGAGAPNEDPSRAGAFVLNLRFPGQVYFAETGLHYNYFRDYDPATGRYVQSDPIGLAGGLNTYGYVSGNPISLYDPTGLQERGAGMPSPTEIERMKQQDCARRAFSRNYQDMRAANWKLSDKYFHCKANCEAARCGKYGYDEACNVSDMRETFDQIKGDPPSASAADQSANRYGRDTANKNPNQTCQVVCAPYRPNGLPSQY